jgi:3-phosphoshikimate 1-carboxyvinyltransferase
MKSDYQFVTIRRPAGLRLQGTIALPPSKSETNRALVIGAFSDKPFTVENYSHSDDSRVVIEFLERAGIEIDRDDFRCTVRGNILDARPEELDIDLHHAGTALRFITALATFLPTTTTLRGSEQLSRRPIATLIDTLTNVGANIDYLEEPGRLPIRIQGNPNLDPTSFKIDVSQSSQMLSALLLVAPRQAPGTRIYFDDNRLVSRSYIDLTLQAVSYTHLRAHET